MKPPEQCNGASLRICRVSCVSLPHELFEWCHMTGISLSTTTSEELLDGTLQCAGFTTSRRIIDRISIHSEEDSGKFEVECIMGHRIQEGIIFYLIKWKNWSHDYNSFEPVTNLDCDDEIFIYKINPKYYKQADYFKVMRKQKSLNYKIQLGRLLRCNIDFTDIIDVFKSHMTPCNRVRFNYKKNLQLKMKITRDYNKKLKSYFMNELANCEREINELDDDSAHIFLENEVDYVLPTSNFQFINDYVTFNSEIRKMMDAPAVIGCKCKDGCMKDDGCCSLLLVQNRNYLSNGILRQEPGFPIMECNDLCSCPPTCSNRVVQRGRKIKVCIYRIEGFGWGVKAVQNIKKGRYVISYLGEVINYNEAERRGTSYDAVNQTYLFDMDFHNRQDFMYTTDGTNYGNVSHFINHSCNPNLRVYCVWVNNQDERFPRISLFASKNIKKGEQLTFDYMFTGNTSDSPNKEKLKNSSKRSSSNKSRHTPQKSPLMKSTYNKHKDVLKRKNSNDFENSQMMKRRRLNSSSPELVSPQLQVTSSGDEAKLRYSLRRKSQIFNPELVASALAVATAEIKEEKLKLAERNDMADKIESVRKRLFSYDDTSDNGQDHEDHEGHEGHENHENLEENENHEDEVDPAPTSLSTKRLFMMKCLCGESNCRGYI